MHAFAPSRLGWWWQSCEDEEAMISSLKCASLAGGEGKSSLYIAHGENYRCIQSVGVVIRKERRIICSTCVHQTCCCKHSCFLGPQTLVTRLAKPQGWTGRHQGVRFYASASAVVRSITKNHRMIHEILYDESAWYSTSQTSHRTRQKHAAHIS